MNYQLLLFGTVNKENKYMDAVDYVIMGIGGALILVGLYLYISGKKDKDSTSNLEGFGIKLNVSNPSILLIVVGVLLLLVPRFFPNASVPVKNIPLGNNPKVIDDVKEQVEPTIPTEPIKMAKVFLPSGTWQLSSYSENGTDLSANIRGTMNFMAQDPQRVLWSSTFVSSDIWGNVYNYNYQGEISGQSNIYTLNITTSNDPGFIRQAPVPLELLQESGGMLHMRYIYQGTEILMHWSQ
jgi:hypothetical protein